MHQVPSQPPAIALLVVLLGLALLIGLPALIGFAFGKRAAAMTAIAGVVLAALVASFTAVHVGVQEDTLRAQSAKKLRKLGDTLRQSHSSDDAADETIIESPIAPPPDPRVPMFAVLLSQHKIVSDPASRPTWIDEAPSLDQTVYRVPVKSGLYSTQEECRQALALAVVQAVVQYGKTYLADSGTAEVLLPPPVGLDASLIKQPLYAETVEASVGPMQQLHVLLEFGNDARAQLHEALRQAAIPRRLRWAASGFGAVLAIVCLLLSALRFDLANGGKHRGRLRWATALTILLVVASAWGLCLL